MTELREMAPSSVGHDTPDSGRVYIVLAGQLNISHGTGNVGSSDGQNIGISQFGNTSPLAPRMPFGMNAEDVLVATRNASRMRAAAVPFSLGCPALGDHISAVVSACAQKEMLVSEARRVIAAMQHIKTIRNGAVAESPSQAMRAPIPSVPPNASIASLAFSSCPNQAFTTLSNSGPETVDTAGFNELVTVKKAHGLTLNPALNPLGLGSDPCLATATALTKTCGDAIIGAHDRPPFDCAALRAVNAAPELHFAHYNTASVG